MSGGCNLCPRRCGAVRPASRDAIGAGERLGLCGMGRTPVVARAALHFWEEPCISGTRGSGTVFFSGCPLRCVFCQNRVISRDGFGKQLTPAALRRVFDRLIEAGAHNINLVTPTHFSDAILEAIGEGLPVPVVYNTGGYDAVETLRRFEGKVSVYLPDMKYALSEPARRYSGAADYPEVAAAAIREMVRQTGPFKLDADGMLIRGVLIRHMLLPGRLENTRRVIDFVADSFPKGTVLFSLMNQYTPMDLPEGYPELARRITTREYTRAQEYMQARGIEDGFVQARSSATDEYVPAFDLTGLDNLE